jgi:hypothetical protein
MHQKDLQLLLGQPTKHQQPRALFQGIDVGQAERPLACALRHNSRS